MARESIATLVVAGLPPEATAALEQRLEGATILGAADEGELRERLREAPHVLVAGGWALGDSPVEAVARWRSTGILAATKVLCCLAVPADAETPSRLVTQLGVSRLLFLPLEVEELLRQVAALAGVTVLPVAEDARARRASAGLAAVWARFREPTLKRIDVMEEAALALLDGALSPAQQAAAQREAHKLAGAAGTFGFPRSSQIARQIEEQLALGGLSPSDAVTLSEQLVALRADLEGTPREIEAQAAESPAQDEDYLLLVGAEPGFAERVESEGAARGLRVVRAADVAAARQRAGAEPPAVVAVFIADEDAAPAALDLVEAMAEAESPSQGLVLAPREATTIRVEAVRRGAQRYLELPASPSSIISHALALAGRASAPPRRILAVDDDPRILELLRTVLGWSAREVHTLEDPLRFWSVLEEVQPELLVLDVDMPHVSGIELARAVRSDPRWAHLPIVFLTARTDADTVRRAYLAGADDHIGKPLVVEELMTRIRNRLERVPMRDETGATDPSTGVGTQRRTADLLTRYFHLARRRGEPLSVASIAVDDLAAITEAHGASGAALAWRATAQLLARSLRGEDVVGRWSADELLVGMYDAAKGDAAQRLAGLLGTLERRLLASPNGGTFQISCSAAVAQYPADGQDLAALHAAASHARREAAERSSGGTVVLAGSGAAVDDDRVVDVVLVDDDEALVGLLEHALVTSGYRVHIYRDGETASTELLAQPPVVIPRVILLDVDLPALNGLDVLRRLQRGGVLERSRVVMLTARASEQDVLTALSLGARDHMTKPFSVAVLLQKLRAAFGDEG